MGRLFRTRLMLFLAFRSICVSTGSLPVPAQNSLGNATSRFDANNTTTRSGASRPQSCGVCGVGGPNVDVYYWPQPNANTSCLSIIGPTPSPPLAGATTANGETYWGYTNKSPPYNIIQTMQLTTINGVTFKMPLLDPWPDTEKYIFQPYTLMEPIGKRGHATRTPVVMEPRAMFRGSGGSPLGNDSFLAGNDNFIESTVIYNGHTL